LRDYIRQQMLEKGAKEEEESDSSDDDDSSSITQQQGLTHVEEQKQLKQDFLKSVEQFEKDNVDSDDLFVRRKKSEEEKLKDNKDFQAFQRNQKEKEQQKELDKKRVDGMKLVVNYWKEEKLNEDESFLRSYILNEEWKEKDKSKKLPTYEEIVGNDQEDLDAQDQFEDFTYLESENPLLSSVNTKVSANKKKKRGKAKQK